MKESFLINMMFLIKFYPVGRSLTGRVNIHIRLKLVVLVEWSGVEWSGVDYDLSLTIVVSSDKLYHQNASIFDKLCVRVP